MPPSVRDIADYKRFNQVPVDPIQDDETIDFNYECFHPRDPEPRESLWPVVGWLLCGLSAAFVVAAIYRLGTVEGWW